MATNDFNFVYLLYAIKNVSVWKIFFAFVQSLCTVNLSARVSLLFFFLFLIVTKRQEDHEIDRASVSRHFHLFIYSKIYFNHFQGFELAKDPTKMTYLTKHIENDELVFTYTKSTVTVVVLHYLWFIKESGNEGDCEGSTR